MGSLVPSKRMNLGTVTPFLELLWGSLVITGISHCLGSPSPIGITFFLSSLNLGPGAGPDIVFIHLLVCSVLHPTIPPQGALPIF